jgi:biotin synthase-like enzyme
MDYMNETDLKAGGSRQTALHQAAAEATRAGFGRNVFVRAVAAVSNFCRENCAYCGMRRDYIIYKRDRFIMTEARVLAAIEAEGLADYYREQLARAMVAPNLAATAVQV